MKMKGLAYAAAVAGAMGASAARAEHPGIFGAGHHGAGGDPALRLVVWSAVEDVWKTGGTAQDVLNAVTQATAWWQSAQPKVTSEDWLFLRMSRFAARDVIGAGGSLTDLFDALDQVVTWWQGVENDLPTNEDRLFRFVVGMTLESVEEDGGTLQDALTAVNGVLAAMAKMSSTTGAGTQTTGSTTGTTPMGPSTGTATTGTKSGTAAPTTVSATPSTRPAGGM